MTDRCNLRCRYCLPAKGFHFLDHAEILSFEEMLALSEICVGMGVRKIRLTGGEPLLRKGVLEFLGCLGELPGAPEVLLTTNGLLLEENLEALRAAGVMRLNVSLDSLRPDTYHSITRCGDLRKVERSLAAADEAGFGIKLNIVVMAGVNDDEICDFVALTRDRDWCVRFIEAMPFDGHGGKPDELVDGETMLDRIRSRWPVEPVGVARGSVAEVYRVPGFIGCFGLIRAHSRTFCSGCRRLRISATGQLRTCLYGQPVLDLRRMLREGWPREVVAEKIREAVLHRHVDGREAEAAANAPTCCSMSRIGG